MVADGNENWSRETFLTSVKAWLFEKIVYTLLIQLVRNTNPCLIQCSKIKLNEWKIMDEKNKSPSLLYDLSCKFKWPAILGKKHVEIRKVLRGIQTPLLEPRMVLDLRDSRTCLRIRVQASLHQVHCFVRDIPCHFFGQEKLPFHSVSDRREWRYPSEQIRKQHS